MGRRTRRRARRIGAYSVWFGSAHLSRPRSRPARDEAVALDALQEFRRRTGGRRGRRPGKLRIYDVAGGPESAPAPPLQRPSRHGNRLNRPAAPGRFALAYPYAINPRRIASATACVRLITPSFT